VARPTIAGTGLDDVRTPEPGPARGMTVATIVERLDRQTSVPTGLI
jgi:hypothetical protein